MSLFLAGVVCCIVLLAGIFPFPFASPSLAFLPGCDNRGFFVGGFSTEFELRLETFFLPTFGLLVIFPLVFPFGRPLPVFPLLLELSSSLSPDEEEAEEPASDDDELTSSSELDSAD